MKSLNRKIKVLRIITRMNVGGPSKHVTNLAQALNNFDCETLLISGEPNQNEGNMFDLAREKHINLKIIRELKQSISPIQDLVAFIKIIKEIKAFNPDIVHTHTSKAGILGRLAALICGVPYIYHTFHGHVFNGYFSKFKSNLIINIEKIFSKFTTNLITLTPKLAGEINSFLKIKSKEKIITIPLGLDLNENLNTTRGNNTWRTQASFKKNDFLLGIIARIVPIKNHIMLINSMKVLHKKYPNLHLIIFGDGELRNTLVELTKKYDLDKYIHFMGIKNNLTDVYSDLDLLVLCSKNEGTPVTLIEALASGCPVASTNVGGVSEVLEGGKIGRLLSLDESKFQEGLSKAIEDIINNCFKEKPDFKTRKKVFETYSINQLANNIYKLYSSKIRKLKR